MESKLKCPNCGHQFEASSAIREEVAAELRVKMNEWKVKMDQDFKSREDELNKKFTDDLSKQKQQMEELIRKNIASDYETKMRLLQENAKENEEKLKQAREKELDFLKKEQELKNKTAELEIEVQKKVAAERETLAEQIRKQEAEKTELKQREFEKKFEDQRKQLEDMKRKLEQGSMQMQGEVLELALEDLLRSEFPSDLIDEVKKGATGADVVQTVVNSLQQICGKIIYESKRTKTFSESWIEKLKNDQREEGASIAVLVTEVMPKDMNKFGKKDEVWICTFQEFKNLVHVLREMIVRLHFAKSAEENKGDKMTLIYNYIISDEFRQRVEGIVEAFSALKGDIEKEKRAMLKIWKEREKQIDKVIHNTINMYGSVKGIAGNAVGNVTALELPDYSDDNDTSDNE